MCDFSKDAPIGVLKRLEGKESIAQRVSHSIGQSACVSYPM